jgi:hypothetical protein
LSDFLTVVGSNLAQVDISSLLQGVGAIWVAIVATAALSTWRKQLHAEKQLTFIDELTDTVHEFILLMASPTSHLGFAKVGIEAHKGAAFGFEKYGNAEAIAYINKSGPNTSDRILKKLALVKPVLGKMQSLVVKGQVLGMPDYSRCQNACAMLAWSHDQIEAFCAIIGDPYLNWEHPDVQKSLSNLSKIDAERINANLQEQNKAFIVFAKKAYEKATR